MMNQTKILSRKQVGGRAVVMQGSQEACERRIRELMATEYYGPQCRHESTTTADGSGAFCKFCGETLA